MIPRGDVPLSLEVALRDLEHHSPRARLRALDALGKAPAADVDRACQALRPFLGDDDPEARYTAALSLGELEDRASVEALIAQIDGDGHPLPRQAAVIALGMIGDPRALKALVQALRHAPPDVRFQAVTSLVQVAPEEAPGPLRRALSDEDQEVRGSAAAALGDLRCQRAANDLVALLQDPYPGVCLEAAVALARLGDRRGSAVLVENLSSGDRQLLAAEHLFRCPDAEVIPHLHRLLGRWFTSPLAKVWAAGALCRLKDGSGKEKLLGLLRNRRIMVRGLAIQVLGELGQPWAMEALQELAAKPEGQQWLREIEDALKGHQGDSQ